MLVCIQTNIKYFTKKYLHDNHDDLVCGVFVFVIFQTFFFIMHYKNHIPSPYSKVT